MSSEIWIAVRKKDAVGNCWEMHGFSDPEKAVLFCERLKEDIGMDNYSLMALKAGSLVTDFKPYSN